MRCSVSWAAACTVCAGHSLCLHVQQLHSHLLPRRNRQPVLPRPAPNAADTFVESTRSPKDDPLVLWLNGGPGCSSLGGGFLAELGPYYPTPGGERLIPNKWAWNR